MPKDYEQYFINFVSSHLIKKLEGNLEAEERIVLTATSYDLINNQVTQIGSLDEATIDLSDQSINSMVQSVQESPT